MRLYFLFILFPVTCFLHAQEPADPGILADFSYAAQLPGGDLSDRFGYNFSAGIGASYITSGKSWIFGLETHFLFGDQIKEDVLATLRTPEGFLIGNDKSFTEILLRQRGLYVGANIGKIISLLPGNPRSGIRWSLGIGLLQHKIRIQDDPIRVVPQIAGEYKKGYDRLTNGLTIKEFIGYQHLDPNRRINFYAGFEFYQGFTRSRRSFQFDIRKQNDENRLDLLAGFRIGWILPFYFHPKDRDIFY